MANSLMPMPSWLRRMVRHAAGLQTVFAPEVRESMRRFNKNGQPHKEYGLTASMPYRALEDAEAFHEIAEHIRIAMIEALRSTGAPINVWRIGKQNGIIASAVNVYTGEGQAYKDDHLFNVRVRASTETPPFTHPDETNPDGC